MDQKKSGSKEAVPAPIPFRIARRIEFARKRGLGAEQAAVLIAKDGRERAAGRLAGS